jgi:hypothetical protein
MSSKKATTVKVKTVRKPAAKRKATFEVTEVKGDKYFKPVNKRAKKSAHALGKRTRVTKPDLKVIAKSYKIYIYVGTGKDASLKAVRV